MKEEWKSYKTYGHNQHEGEWLITDLEISNLGNVRGNKFRDRLFTQDMIKVNPEGRKVITYVDGKRGMPIYRLVWKLFKGEVPKGYVIHHKDNMKTDDSLDNLELMTKSEHIGHHASLREKTEKQIEHARQLGLKYNSLARSVHIEKHKKQ